jgi:hypothetical protein
MSSGISVNLLLRALLVTLHRIHLGWRYPIYERPHAIIEHHDGDIVQWCVLSSEQGHIVRCKDEWDLRCWFTVEGCVTKNESARFLPPGIRVQEVY